MTREEAIARIKNHKIAHKMNEPREQYISEALDMAIKALEQELCDDAISRQAALQCCRNEWEEEVETRLKSLPPVTLQQKYEDIVKAFQFGLAFGFGTKHDEMDKVIKEIKKATRDCKTCGHSNGGKCAYTEECHECMFENKYIEADKEE